MVGRGSPGPRAVLIPAPCPLRRGALGSPRWPGLGGAAEGAGGVGPAADPDADQEAVLADELAAAADGRMSAPDVAWTAAVAVEHMAPGAAQAGVAGGRGRGGRTAG